MPPKKATTGAPAKKAAAAPAHPTYKDMIKESILNLKERNGSSRVAIKKYIQANNNLGATSEKAFAAQLNRAIRTGVEGGDFSQPKGPSGPVKLAKKDAAKAASKPSAPKSTATKTAKKPAAKKAAAPKKPATKAAVPKKPAAPATKANASKPRKAPKAPTAAPAVVEKPAVLTKTKSGRVAKTTKPAAPAKKAAAKKAAPKKAAAPKKSATPKKTEAA
ncbi:MAG: hypothetical protein M1819_006761 [Sarea resinae]|nr:MAG: hypothetical protein M1819_006761 [Sarea resinae]